MFVLPGFFLNFASTATKKISDSVVETAHTIKKTVEESNIDGIIDNVRRHQLHIDRCGNVVLCVFFLTCALFVFIFVLQTILGDFQKEQEKFVQEKNAKKTGMCCGFENQ